MQVFAQFEILAIFYLYEFAQYSIRINLSHSQNLHYFIRIFLKSALVCNVIAINKNILGNTNDLAFHKLRRKNI